MLQQWRELLMQQAAHVLITLRQVHFLIDGQCFQGYRRRHRVAGIGEAVTEAAQLLALFFDGLIDGPGDHDAGDGLVTG
ncbi:hypothetical protein D9M71_797990 [compost metagenome]